VSETTVTLGISQLVHISDKTLAELNHRAHTGGLKCEFGVPKVYDGASPQERADRYKVVLPERVCAEISNVARGEDGVSIIATITPKGPMSKIVKQAIRSGRGPELGFSVRAITTGEKVQVVTYDLVKF